VRIGIDGRALPREGAAGLRQARGIARYLGELLGALAAAFPEDEWRVLVPRGAELPDAARRPNVVQRRTRRDGRAARAAAALLGRPRADAALGEVDVMWLPAPVPVAVSPGLPYVLTVHDLSPLSRPGDFGRYERLWTRLMRPRRLAARAAALIAVSQATREEAVRLLGVPTERVHVVRSGAPAPAEPAAHAVEEVRRRLGLPERYFLFVGALEPRKAPDVLVDAHARSRDRGLEAGLVLAGDGPLRDALDASGGQRLLGRVDEADLAPLYAGAVATVLPSHLEGFGFTPLESLAAGTPAVVSDLPALREVLGEGALAVPPGDADALAEALLAMERDERLRRRLLDAGRTAAADLTWERAARETRAVLERAAGAP
jgi:glycosyltransferase involved in cell wall biosynthesis